MDELLPVASRPGRLETAQNEPIGRFQVHFAGDPGQCPADVLA
jgi:hypothetical protein